MGDLFGVPVSAGSVVNFQVECSGALARFMQRVRQAGLASPVAGADETGLRVGGASAWLHTFSTGELTAMHADRRRGRAGMDAGGILTEFDHTLVHDALASYDTLDKVAAHALSEVSHSFWYIRLLTWDDAVS
jgi:transposase